jgi:putative ABC transport system permease protein
MRDDDKTDDKWLHRCLAVVEWFCPPQLLEGVAGDLWEQYDNDLARLGRKRSRRRLVWGTLRFFHHEIILRNKLGLRLINTIMLASYIRVATRNIQKRKLYSAINAFGLSIGIAFCMLIWLFIKDEQSFDQFHENKNEIVRIEALSYNYWNPNVEENKRWSQSAYIQLGLAAELKNDLPEVILATRFNDGTNVVKNGDRVFSESVSYVDGDFFRMFSFPLISGNREKLFSNSLEIVITPAVATKYFDDEDPLGKTLVINEKSFTVAGVISPPPANSSFDYKILIPQENRPWYEWNLTKWGNFSTPTFVQLRPGTAHAAFEANMNKVIDKHMKSVLVDWRKEGNLPPDMEILKFYSTPLLGIHMKKDTQWHKASDPQYSFILGGIALLILLIACINYISLALTTSAARRTEVGIRKVVGAQRNQLLYQFGFESILLAVLSALAGIGFVTLFLPWFNEFTDKDIHLAVGLLLPMLGVGVGLGIAVGAVAGAYPAIFLSRFRPALVLKGGFTARLQAGFTRPLVALQFVLSAFLIISSTIMFRQMQFVATRDLGFKKDAVLVVPTQARRDGEERIQRLRTLLEREKNVITVGAVDQSFNKGWSRSGYKIDGVNKNAYVYAVDPYYVPALGMELVAGRNFDVNIAADSDAIIVNEALARDMKWDDPVGQHYNWREDTVGMGALVIGVVKDYHYLSLESPIEPLLLTREWPVETAMIKMSGEDIPGTIEAIRKGWKELYPDSPFEYSFLDDDIAEQYKSYERWIQVMGFATGFAIVISCLGLFGLAGINAVNRTKEIGIRKVMGAELASIFLLLNRQYVILSLIAFACAIPLSYYVMSKWLASFEFRVPMGWEVFALSFAVSLIVAVLTVSYHGLKAATVNPAETLKYE